MPVSQPTSRELAHIRQRVLTLSDNTHGVFRRQHLTEWGLDPGIVKAMTRRGWWTRMHHGVYVDANLLAPELGMTAVHLVACAAAIMALPLPAYAFGVTAASLHGQPLQRGLLREVELTRNLGTDQRALRRRITDPTALTDVKMHGHALDPSQLTLVAGIPTVSADLAAISAAARSSQEWAVVTLDAVSWQRPDAPAVLRGITEDWPRLRGIGNVRRALPLVRSGAQTPLETLSRLRIVAGGLPEPELQVPFYDEDGLIGFADMTWLNWRVIGESDGELKYGSRKDLIEEKLREDRLRRLGYTVVRWTWEEIWRRPEIVTRRILRARTDSRYGSSRSA